MDAIKKVRQVKEGLTASMTNVPKRCVHMATTFFQRCSETFTQSFKLTLDS